MSEKKDKEVVEHTFYVAASNHVNILFLNSYCDYIKVYGHLIFN